VVDVDATPHLIELSEAYDASLQARDVIHSNEGMVASILAGEDDVATALDLGDGTVAEFHHAADLEVELGEDLPRSGHMVDGAGVEDPSAVVTSLHRA
jgi:hypothetical protein